MSTRLPTPSFADESDFAARQTDVSFWAPYIHEVLRRHGLPQETPLSGAGGTFPTFLVGRYVARLFGALFAGATCYQAEQSFQRMLLAHPEIPVPRLVAEGQLYSEGWPWPYLVTTRLSDVAWCDAELSPDAREPVAREPGA